MKYKTWAKKTKTGRLVMGDALHLKDGEKFVRVEVSVKEIKRKR